MKYLAMIAIVLLCFGFAFYQFLWFAFALRNLIFAVVLLGLVVIVIRSIKWQ